jgi:hypothetical protein
VKEVGGLHDGGTAGQGVRTVLEGFAGCDARLAGAYAVGASEAFVYNCGLGGWVSGFAEVGVERLDYAPGMVEPPAEGVGLDDLLLASRS